MSIRNRSFAQFSKYSTAGAALLVSNYLMFWPLFWLLRDVVPIAVIAGTHYLLSAGISHHVYREFVFSESKTKYLVTLFRYFISTGAIAGFSIGLLSFLYGVVGLNIFVSQALAFGLTLGIGYLAGAKFTFRQRIKLSNRETIRRIDSEIGNE